MGVDFRKQLVFEAKELNYTSMDEAFIRKAVDCVNAHLSDCDFEHAQFTVESSGMVDFSTNFYATNVLEDDRERKIMWGAVEGFSNTKDGMGAYPFRGSFCFPGRSSVAGSDKRT